MKKQKKSSKNLTKASICKNSINNNNIMNKKLQSGITLIALVISIIVMLILAGVSINAIVGDNGVLTKAQDATIRSRFASYNEEFEMNKASVMIEKGIDTDLAVNVLGTDEEFLEYVPNISEADRSKFEIISGYLVYTGSDSLEENAAKGIGLFSQYDQALYDVIGKEFEVYILAVENAKASGEIPESIQNLRKATFEQLNNCLPKGSKIPEKYKNDFILSTGILTYTGNNEERLILLSTSDILAQYIRPVSGSAKLILQNYVSPIEGNISDTTVENSKTIYKVKTNDDNYWTVRIDSQSGSMKYGTIIQYEGVGGTITIPDKLNIQDAGIVSVTSVEGKGNGTGASRTFVKNIFQNDSGESTVTTDIMQVIVAKGIYEIKNYALSNLGSNKPFTILHDGADLNLDEGTGIEGSCGSYTYVASATGTYTLKCWGASGAGWDKVKAEANDWGSDAGYGGYSEGTVTLNEGEKLYVNVGGKGLAPFEVVGDITLGTSNGSGGYNGGGNLPKLNSTVNNAGGGCTDIRFGGSTIEKQILVAGGGGGCDDFSSDYITNASSGTIGKNIKSAFNDGSGGAGGGTISSTDKTTWSGGAGYINGILWDEEILATSFPQVTLHKDALKVWSDGYSLPGMWKLVDGNYVASGKERLKGGDSKSGSDFGAGGGGYYGGVEAYHHEGGGGGGSAYADIEGTLKQVTVTKGYVDLTEVTREASGEKVQGAMLNSQIPQVTYYGRPKPALTYGNGFVEISK